MGLQGGMRPGRGQAAVRAAVSAEGEPVEKALRTGEGTKPNPKWRALRGTRSIWSERNGVEDLIPWVGEPESYSSRITTPFG